MRHYKNWREKGVRELHRFMKVLCGTGFKDVLFSVLFRMYCPRFILYSV